MKKLFLFCAVFFVGIEKVVAGNLGSYPTYSILRQADTVAILWGSDQGEPFKTDINLEGKGMTMETSNVEFAKGGAPVPFKFISDLLLPPPATRSRILYLKKQNGAPFKPVNQLCSTIPTSQNAGELTKLLGAQWKKQDLLDFLPDIFVVEKDGQCALLQAQIIITGPRELAQRAWKALENPSTEGCLGLAQTVVGIYAVGGRVFEHGCQNLSDIGETPEGPSMLPEMARASIASWFHKHGKGEENIAPLLNFALLQKGEFQGDLLVGIAEKFPKARIAEIYRLMKSTDNLWVKYSCCKATMYALNKGQGIPAIEIFEKDQKKFFQDCLQLIKSSGFIDAAKEQNDSHP